MKMRLEQIMCYESGWSDRYMVKKDSPASPTSMWHQRTGLTFFQTYIQLFSQN